MFHGLQMFHYMFKEIKRGIEMKSKKKTTKCPSTFEKHQIKLVEIKMIIIEVFTIQ